jgi:hypothetical protein
MRKISLCLFAILISSNLSWAKSSRSGFSYKCQVGNPNIFQSIGKRGKANNVPTIGDNGNIVFTLNKNEPVANLDGEVNRNSELVEVNLELKGISLASSKASRPRVQVSLKDKTNDEEIFSARSIDPDYDILEDITVKCDLEVKKIKNVDQPGLGAALILLFLSAGQ